MLEVGQHSRKDLQEDQYRALISNSYRSIQANMVYMHRIKLYATRVLRRWTKLAVARAFGKWLYEERFAKRKFSMLTDEVSSHIATLGDRPSVGVRGSVRRNLNQGVWGALAPRKCRGGGPSNGHNP